MLGDKVVCACLFFGSSLRAKAAGELHDVATAERSDRVIK